MPFTLSHAVIAPPIAKFLRLPLASLAIGCMAPDLIRMLTDDNQVSILAHTWQGLLYPTLATGILFSVVWYALYRPVIYHFCKLNHDLNLRTWQDYLKFIAFSIIALLIGIATHIIWDGFTHLDFRTIAFKQQLAQIITIGSWSYPLHFILQIACSVIALPFLAYFCWAYYQQYKIDYHYQIRDYIYIVLLIILPNSLGFWVFYQFFLQYHLQLSPYQLIGRSINIFSSSAMIIVSFLCILFLLMEKICHDK